MHAESHEPRDVDEPIAWLRAFADGVEPRALPLFRRPARVTVGSGRGCDWRFEGAELAELELVLAWDGVRLRAEDAARPAERTTIRNGQSIIAGATGRLRIALEVVLFDEEVTVIRRVAPAPASEETTAPVPRAAPEEPTEAARQDDERTVITVAPPPPPSPPSPSPPLASPGRIYQPPRHGAADDDPTVDWPLADALRPTADLLDRLSSRGLRALARRAPPRRLALFAALALVVAVEATLLLRGRHRALAPPPRPTVLASAAASAHVAAADRRTRVVLPDKDLEVDLHRAIAAYRAGKTAEALAAFGRVAADSNDPAARTMLFILRSRGAATTP